MLAIDNEDVVSDLNLHVRPLVHPTSLNNWSRHFSGVTSGSAQAQQKSLSGLKKKG